MSSPYLGDIRLGGWNFAPVGWLPCDGRLLNISEYDALYAVVGTTYGGDGQQTFAVPDLRGRLPIHTGTNAGVTYTMGIPGGAETVQLTPQQMPQHSHALVASTVTADQAAPANGFLAQPTTANMYIQDTPDGSLAASAVGVVGGNLPHDNTQPFLCLTYIIATEGIFPSRS